MFRALYTTIKNSLRKPVTEVYPTEVFHPPARFRGKHIFYDELCIGCSLCAKVCPNNTIIMLERPEQKDPKLKHRPLIDLNRCIFCGYCAEVCPAKCLFMGNDYEMAETTKARLIMTYPDMIASPGAERNRRAIYPALEEKRRVQHTPSVTPFAKDGSVAASKDGSAVPSSPGGAA
jgi:NADH-quinone oxidoreductase chain I